ncbi:DUF2461 domain-containing protein [Robertkochia solimangrovi]|uniref:DUF2461 domain-containing protein n=1 Tax=Robertkochia solimangrovi TaxID=2213046 RepID=UPI001F550549|nr:DUF2461 domain-containing protein [Robertkochia solimangrovi]
MLTALKTNNNREWFEANKKEFKTEEQKAKKFFNNVHQALQQHDEVDKMKMFRIYRDVRFSADKTPYKTHFSSSFHRVKPRLRGGYYLHIEPGNSFLATGFWNPEKSDLERIRREFAMDDEEIRHIMEQPEFKNTFGSLVGDELKTAPKGYDRDHKAIDLIRKKQYIATRKFTDKEVLDPDFAEVVNKSFRVIRPFFDYMSEVLTTDLNGISLIE